MEHRERLDGVQAQIAAMSALLDRADLSTPVAGCPGWDLAELAKHTGWAHRWAELIIARRATEFVPFKQVELGLPEDIAARPRWLADGAGALLVALGQDPNTSVWTFGPDNCVGWWARRMLHETVVHRVDAELAVGIEPVIDTQLALDGIEEFVVDMVPSTGAQAKVAALGRPGDSLHLHATDSPGEWTLTLTEDGYRVDPEHSKATAAVRGSAADLYLLVWNRRRVDDAGRFEMFGDATLVDGWLAAAAI